MKEACWEKAYGMYKILHEDIKFAQVELSNFREKILNRYLLLSLVELPQYFAEVHGVEEQEPKVIFSYRTRADEA